VENRHPAHPAPVPISEVEHPMVNLLPRCAVCSETHPVTSVRRFGGRRVCPECWQGLSRLARSWAFRGFPRTSLLALFTAEVAVRQAG
jgi:hypothetical protein